jgi:hypothetical protein
MTDTDNAQNERNLPAQEVIERGCRAAVGHMRDFDLRRRVQPRSSEVMRRPDPGRADRELAGIGLGIGDQLLDIVHGKRGMREQHERLSRDQPDRHEVVRHIVRDTPVHPLCQNSGRLHEQQSVSVGRRLGDEIGADHGAGTRSIFHRNRLLELLLQLLGQNACRSINPAAGCNRHHQCNWPRRIGLRRDHARDCRKRGNTPCQMQKSTARKFHDVHPGDTKAILIFMPPEDAWNFGDDVGPASLPGAVARRYHPQQISA